MSWRFKDVKSLLMGESETIEQPLCTLLSYSMFQPTTEKIKERIASYQSSAIHMYACVENDVYLGLIVFRLEANTATVLDIAVHEQERECGVGSFLIDSVVNESKVSRLFAETDDDAVGFYKAYGFTVFDTKIKCGRNRYLCRYLW